MFRFLPKVVVILLLLSSELALSFEYDMIEEENRDFRSGTESSRSPRTPAGILSSLYHRRLDSSASTQTGDRVIVSPSVADQKPTRASLFFSGNNNGGGFLSGLLGGQQNQVPRTILLAPASGALTASACCPCSGVGVGGTSGALIAPGMDKNY